MKTDPSTMALPQTADPRSTTSTLEQRIALTGSLLRDALQPILHAIPAGPHPPHVLARELALDKVLVSRLLKGLRARDPMAVIHHLPGPEPLRRFLLAAARAGVPAELIVPARHAVDHFEHLIRQDTGDRSALDAIISAWLPEARRAFELRRKQSAFKAMSHLKGAMAVAQLATVILHPSDDGRHLDIVWIFALLGLQRLRPNTSVKFVSRRMASEQTPRRPLTLEGAPIDSVHEARLDSFCDRPPAEVVVQRAGETVHYVLGGESYGPGEGVDLIVAEVNLREIPRYVPREENRKGNVFAEVGTPVRALFFDVLVHEEVYRGSEPGLVIYDTALEGVANVNDRSRDLDRLDQLESVQALGRGAAALRLAQIPQYVDMLRHVFEKLNWSEGSFRGYRCRIDYPIYGSQVAMTFDPPPPPEE